MLSHPRRLVFAFIVVGGATIGALALVEAGLRVKASVERVPNEGAGASHLPDARWGWKPRPGFYRIHAREFVAEGVVNDDFMNDRPFVPHDDRDKVRLFVVGDSHTFAYGVSAHQTWVRRLEDRLNDGVAARRYRTYNAAGIGYNVHQYVLRVADQAPPFQPHVVLAGISFATDLFDLLPPDRGGWIYGGDFERDYFDFDKTGALRRRHWSASGPAETAARPMPSRLVRELALQLAIVRAIRRSPLALLVARRVRLEGRSLWPNIDVVMERDVAPAHEYQYRLFKALLARLAQESSALGATLVVVGIPYLPQVYPAIARAFQHERYDSDALSRRIAAYCAEAGVRYVDTLPAFRRSFATTGRWLHYPDDGHPTPEGHDLIAQTVAESARLNVSTDPATQPVGRSHPR